MIANRTANHLAPALAAIVLMTFAGWKLVPTPGPQDQHQEQVSGHQPGPQDAPHQDLAQYQPKFRVAPGDVSPNWHSSSNPSHPKRVRGSFELVPDPNGSPMKTGGGCLVYRPLDTPMPCQNDGMCTQFVPDPAKGYGYCDSPATAHPTCWIKNNDSDCLKFRTTEMTEGVTYRIPTSSPDTNQLPGLSAFPLGPSRPVAWRVITCQNITPGGCAGGIEGQNKITRYGTPWQQR